MNSASVSTKARSAALAFAALTLCLSPSTVLAQHKSRKTPLVICHIPPGNPEARQTMTVVEPGWGAHGAHGDTLGPCGEYRERQDDDDRADADHSKKAKEKKKQHESPGDSD